MPFADTLVSQGVLKTPEIISAFNTIKREDFIEEEVKEFAEYDQALPIGSGQTISQPYVVAFMMEHLRPKKGDRILDIGAGSGWTTALLSHIVGERGRVIGIEIIGKLMQTARKHVDTYSFIKKGIAEIIEGDGRKGYEQEAPYDGILVSAAMEEEELPSALKKQLKVGGKIVIPIKESIWVFEKTGEHQFKEQEYPGFVFVPLVKES
ncbi:MAG TPA: protein-L-isoaspartate O-methyltransferase [Candidatus Wildermuthbacteria bacterium]|nr:protein-L-isoaspartate O-methyltransferase [Candidatus Wildermuthbacteria bacterium]